MHPRHCTPSLGTLPSCAKQSREMLENSATGMGVSFCRLRGIISITTRTAVRRGSHEWVPASLFDILPTFKPSVNGLSNAPCKPHDLKIWMTDANKSRAFPVHVMMANKWGGGIIPLINLRTIWRWVVDHLTPGYLISRKLGGPLSRSVTFWRKRNLTPHRDSNPGPSIP